MLRFIVWVLLFFLVLRLIKRNFRMMARRPEARKDESNPPPAAVKSWRANDIIDVKWEEVDKHNAKND